MSGRIAAVAGVNQDGRITLFVGSASGGVWKSVDGGTTFKPVFDQQDVQSIGAVAIDPSNPKNVWVGTGESWMRNSVRSATESTGPPTAAKTGTNVGLKDSEQSQDPHRSEGRQHACWRAPPDTRGTTATTAASTGPPTAARPGRKLLAGANGSTGCGMLAASPQEPVDHLCLHVGLPAARVDLPLGRPGQRNLSLRRWRRCTGRS